jgi:hypothetical protein
LWLLLLICRLLNVLGLLLRVRRVLLLICRMLRVLQLLRVGWVLLLICRMLRVLRLLLVLCLRVSGLRMSRRMAWLGGRRMRGRWAARLRI